MSETYLIHWKADFRSFADGIAEEDGTALAATVRRALRHYADMPVDERRKIDSNRATKASADMEAAA